MGGATVLIPLDVEGSPEFQSTLPVGGATPKSSSKYNSPSISIHAPRGGSDAPQFISSIVSLVFQSTLPVGGATKVFLLVEMTGIISIHAPRGGSD